MSVRFILLRFTRAHADGVRFVYSSENFRSILWTPWILFQCIIAFKKIYYREDITDCNRHTIVFYKSKLQRSMSLAYGVPGCYYQLLEACGLDFANANPAVENGSQQALSTAMLKMI